MGEGQQGQRLSPGRLTDKFDVAVPTVLAPQLQVEGGDQRGEGVEQFGRL